MSEVVASGETRGKRKTQIGLVVKSSGNKTISVEVHEKVQHPKFKKFVSKKFKFLAHDEKNESQLGDVVKIMETRPYSKLKRWRLVQIIKH